MFYMGLSMGKVVNDQQHLQFAEINARKLLNHAYIPINGRWASGYVNSSKEMEGYNVSLIYNELNQMSATLS